MEMKIFSTLNFENPQAYIIEIVALDLVFTCWCGWAYLLQNLNLVLQVRIWVKIENVAVTFEVSILKIQISILNVLYILTSVVSKFNMDKVQ